MLAEERAKQAARLEVLTAVDLAGTRTTTFPTGNQSHWWLPLAELPLPVRDLWEVRHGMQWTRRRRLQLKCPVPS